MSEVLTREIDELRLLMGSSRDPHGRVFAQLGNALRRAGSHREALDVLRDGVSEHPNFAPGHLVLAWTAQEVGDLEAARTAYERTVELDPENPNGLFGLGLLLDRDGSPRGASLIEEAESLDARVREAAPGFPGPQVVDDSSPAEAGEDFSIEVPGADSAGDAPLEDLPFVPLAELAPDGAQETGPTPDHELSDLPFVALDDLAPDPVAEASGEAAAGADDLESLPFVALDDLRPEEVEPTEEETPDVLGGPLATRTMGELLVRQGLTAEAVEVFEALVARSPGDEGLRVRLEELRESLSSGTSATPVDGPEEAEGSDDVQVVAESDVSPASGSADEIVPLEGVGDLERAEDETDEVAAHPSMDPPVPHPEVPSPFHLGDGEADDAGEEGGEAVRDYFARLLAWSPDRVPSEGDSGGGSVEGEESTSP